MFLCGFACLHAPFLLRIQQMEPWDGGYPPSRSPLDCNSLSTMCRGPERPAICLLLLVQRWDISNHHLVDVYSARDTLSLRTHTYCVRAHAVRKHAVSLRSIPVTFGFLRFHFGVMIWILSLLTACYWLETRKQHRAEPTTSRQFRQIWGKKKSNKKLLDISEQLC